MILGGVNPAAAVVGGSIFRIEFEGFGIVGQGNIVAALIVVGFTPVGVGDAVFRV